jgi:hypothetical protein
MIFKNIYLIIIHFLFKKEIFLINSPLQLMNMVELINYKLIKKKKILFVGYTDFNTIQQIKAAIDIKYINKRIKLIFLSENINIFFIHNFLRIRRFFLCKFKVSYIGDYKYYLFREICRISKKKWIVDDGASTLDFNNFNKIDTNNCYFFSIFKIPIKTFQIENKYYEYKKRVKSKKIVHHITFIGDASVEKGLVRKDIFLKKLKLFSEKNNNKIIYYYPHRAESIIFNYINAFSNIRIQKNFLNIELDLLNKGYLTSRFVSFYSSALFTIKKMLKDRYNIKFQYIPFDYRHINKRFNLIIKNTEKGYKQEGIKLIKY